MMQRKRINAFYSQCAEWVQKIMPFPSLQIFMVQRKRINAFYSQCAEWVQKSSFLDIFKFILSIHARRRFPRRSYHSSSSASSLTEITKLTPSATSGVANFHGAAQTNKCILFSMCRMGSKNKQLPRYLQIHSFHFIMLVVAFLVAHIILPHQRRR
jgi:hypothetical protein